MTNWSTFGPLTPYTTHQEFLTRPLEGPDQRLQGQLAIRLQLDIIRGDALKDSHHISRVKQPGQDGIWKMSNLGFGRLPSLIYWSWRLSYLWKASLFSLGVHWTWSGDVERFQHVPVGAWTLTRVLACRQNASVRGMGGLISAPAGLRWAVDGSQTIHTTSELPSSSYWCKGLSSLCLLTCSKQRKQVAFEIRRKKYQRKGSR